MSHNFYLQLVQGHYLQPRKEYVPMHHQIDSDLQHTEGVTHVLETKYGIRRIAWITLLFVKCFREDGKRTASTSFVISSLDCSTKANCPRRTNDLTHVYEAKQELLVGLPSTGAKLMALWQRTSWRTSFDFIRAIQFWMTDRSNEVWGFWLVFATEISNGDHSSDSERLMELKVPWKSRTSLWRNIFYVKGIFRDASWI